MATKTGITLIKEMTYRDLANEEWSNQYWFKGAPPATQSAWQDLVNQLQGGEIGCYSSNSKTIAAYGYDSNDPKAHAVFSWDASTGFPSLPGTLLETGRPAAGDQAGMIEWKTTSKNQRGKWIYLRKFFHSADLSATDRDKLATNTVTAYDAFAQFVAALHGGLTAQANDYVISDALVSEWITTRTLKRRGKRPLAPT